MMGEKRTSKFYQERAAELRALADKATFPEIKRQLLMIAAQYEDLAASVELTTRPR